MPELVLLNSGASGDYQINEARFLEIYHDGTVVYAPEKISTTSCALNVEDFPLDRQSCELKIYSLLYDRSYITLDFAMESSNCKRECCSDINKDDYSDGIEWALVGKETKIQDHKEFNEDKYIYQLLNYKFTVRRKARWMTVYIMLPCIVVTILAACVFYLPANSCEKTTLAITVLIITTFFLTILPKVSPQSSLGIPLVNKWLTFSLIITTLEQLVCVYRIRHDNFQLFN